MSKKEIYMLELLHNLTVNVSNSLPDDTSLKAKENFIYNAVLNVLVSGNSYMGVVCGVIALAASFFDSIGNSLIRNLFEVDTLTWYQDYSKKILVLNFLQAALSLFSISFNLIYSLALICLFDLYQGTMFSDKKIDHSSFIFIIN
jgi:hypothetical protein